jgi:hypothetical protein
MTSTRAFSRRADYRCRDQDALKPRGPIARWHVRVHDELASLSTHRNKKTHRLLHRTPTSSTVDVFNRNLLLEPLCDANEATAKKEAAPRADDGATKTRIRERTIMETPAKQTPTASNEIVMLIRKLRWAGLEEKAEELEKELEQSAVTDRVVPMQNETD